MFKAIVRWFNRPNRECQSHPRVREQVGVHSGLPEYICLRCKRRVPAGEVMLFDIPTIKATLAERVAETLVSAGETPEDAKRLAEEAVGADQVGDAG